jgi:uncharacterized protein YecT (DUF1311 family)
MKKILLTFLLAITATFSANNLKILNDGEDSDTAEVEMKGNGESCKLWFASTGDIDKGSCHYMVNSKGVRIYCTPKKKMCKTYDEIHTFIFSPSVESSSEVDKEGYSNEYKRCLDNSGGVTTNMRACSKQELSYQDKLLNRYYKQAMKVLDDKKRKELKQVQRQWIKYRDAKCGFDYGLTGGTMDLVIGDGCMVDMTAQRADELKSIVDMLE